MDKNKFDLSKLDASKKEVINNFIMLPHKQQVEIKRALIKEYFISRYNEGTRKEIIYAEIMKLYGYKQILSVYRILSPRELVNEIESNY
jgi:hypothetical protein